MSWMHLLYALMGVFVFILALLMLALWRLSRTDLFEDEPFFTFDGGEDLHDPDMSFAGGGEVPGPFQGQTLSMLHITGAEDGVTIRAADAYGKSQELNSHEPAKQPRIVTPDLIRGNRGQDR